MYNQVNNAQQGHIELICGPMFSGKSSYLMDKVRRLRIAKKNVLLLNYALDDRYSKNDVVSSHDQIMLQCKKIQTLSQIADIYDQFDVIAIDEGQFFSDIVEMSNKFADNGKHVIIGALDADFRREPFGNINLLLSKAEIITKLKAVCVGCQGNASFTRRTTEETEICIIGSSDKYEPVCRGCFLENSKKEKLVNSNTKSNSSTSEEDINTQEFSNITCE